MMMMGPMGMPNMPMGMQGGNGFMNMNNFGMNQGEDEEWLKGFALGVQEVKGTQEEVDDGRPKLNAIFTTTKGKKTNMILSHGTTIDQAIEKYLKKMGNIELYRNKSNRICFLFNGAQMKFGDQTKVENYFGHNTNPNIIVNDVYNLIGA
jgi:hypothetical protein